MPKNRWTFPGVTRPDTLVGDVDRTLRRLQVVLNDKVAYLDDDLVFSGKVTINPGPLIVGVDPGGPQILRVGGSISLQAGAAIIGQGSLSISVTGINVITFNTGAAARWQISATGGWNAAVDNAIDIGETALVRPRTLRLGTSLIIGADPGGADPLRVAGDITATDVNLRGLTYTWPAIHGAGVRFLQNDGTGTLTWVAGSGGGTTVNTGTAEVDFGAAGGADASLAITGQAGILAGSIVWAWLIAAATADHTADEHLVETLEVRTGSIIAGTGFTITLVNSSQLVETPVGAMPDNRGGGAGRIPRIMGKWKVAWAWI